MDIEFFTAENMIYNVFHHRLKAVYGDYDIDKSTLNRWAIKFRDCELEKPIINDEKHNGHLITNWSTI